MFSDVGASSLVPPMRKLMLRITELFSFTKLICGRAGTWPGLWRIKKKIKKLPIGQNCINGIPFLINFHYNGRNVWTIFTEKDRIDVYSEEKRLSKGIYLRSKNGWVINPATSNGGEYVKAGNLLFLQEEVPNFYA